MTQWRSIKHRTPENIVTDLTLAIKDETSEEQVFFNGEQKRSPNVQILMSSVYVDRVVKFMADCDLEHDETEEQIRAEGLKNIISPYFTTMRYVNEAVRAGKHRLLDNGQTFIAAVKSTADAPEWRKSSSRARQREQDHQMHDANATRGSPALEADARYKS